ncbi:hypothetical protein SCMU_00280 [Sinomonas cyclohexanicum]|uniref:Uncharacterized protein n=1 Tax=Sinomonas cyclohexanicum TaxID=322009 RepID=A0ABN6FAJ9_SINCY|nr:hypothetical protein SCMU_00280 [Corynebacterium cyclohexanicum]
MTPLPCRPRRLAVAGVAGTGKTAQSHVYVMFLKGTKFKDGTFLMDKAEEYGRREFAAHQARGSDPLGRKTAAPTMTSGRNGA